MTSCPSYWLAGDIHCGLAAEHDGHHVGAPEGPNPRRQIFRWRGGSPRTIRDFAGLKQTEHPARQSDATATPR